MHFPSVFLTQPSWTASRLTCPYAVCQCVYKSASSSGSTTSGSVKNHRMKITFLYCFRISSRRRSHYMFTWTLSRELKSFRTRRPDFYANWCSNCDPFSSRLETTFAEKVARLRLTTIKNITPPFLVLLSILGNPSSPRFYPGLLLPRLLSPDHVDS